VRSGTPFATAVPCSTLDIFPTILEAIGAKTPYPARPLDGISLLPLLDHQMETRSKAIPFWDHNGKLPGHAALLDWPYKLHTNPVAARGKKPDPTSALPAALLYDVSKDPKETTDLASQEPERVAKMTATLEAWKASVEKSLAGDDYAQAAKQ
jgi:arylsulfatase A-like enzyme